jgi:hypothetical protein
VQDFYPAYDRSVRSFDDIHAMSGLPLQADLRASSPFVSEVPQPDSCTAAKEAHRLAQSINSSASNCIELGTSRPSALAVCRLMTNSNLVDCKIGKSAGFAPLRI